MTVYFSEGAELLEWTDDRWLGEAHAWIDAKLAELGLERSEPIVQVYVRSWSTVLRVPITTGTLYFKASAPVQAFEVALVRLLARLRDDVVAPLASDEERGWMLMADGGIRLRESPANTDVGTWERIVRQYAELQLAVAPHVEALHAIGVDDLRLAVLPDRFERFLDDNDLLLVDLDDADRARLAHVSPRLVELCGELEAYRIAATIEHDDLHAGNIFLDGAKASFFDWGDASISHPFHTMRTTLRVIAETLEVAGDDRDVMRVRDAYLAPYGDVSVLRKPFELAQRTAVVTKALTFARFVAAMPAAFRERRYDEVIAAVSRRILDVV